MARASKTSKIVRVVEVPTQGDSPQTVTQTQESNTMSSLTLEDITGILAGTRSRTNSGAFVQEFAQSGELGREVDLTSGTFAGKEAKKVKTALDNARKKMTDDGKLVIPEGPQLAVRVKDGKCYIINTALVSEAQAAA